MRHSWELTVPADIVEDAMEELSQGVRITIESSVRLWREKRMSASELESLLHSVAWQSPTLKDYFEDRMPRRSPSEDDDEPFEVMSAQDMAALMAGCESSHTRKKARVEHNTDDATRSAMEMQTTAQSKSHGLPSTNSPLHAKSFKNLSMCGTRRYTEEAGENELPDFDITEAFGTLGNMKSPQNLPCCSAGDFDNLDHVDQPKLAQRFGL